MVPYSPLLYPGNGLISIHYTFLSLCLVHLNIFLMKEQNFEMVLVWNLLDVLHQSIYPPCCPQPPCCQLSPTEALGLGLDICSQEGVSSHSACFPYVPDTMLSALYEFSCGVLRAAQCSSHKSCYYIPTSQTWKLRP